MPVTDFGIDFRHGRVFLDAVDADLVEVLRTLARRSGIAIEIDADIRDTVTLRLDGVGIEAALGRLCRNRAIVYTYHAESKTFRVLRVTAMAPSAHVATPLSEDRVSMPSGDAVAGLPSNAGTTASAPTAPRLPSDRTDQKTEPLRDHHGRLLYLPGELLVRFKTEARPADIATLHANIGCGLIDGLANLKLHRIQLPPGVSAAQAIAYYQASELVENAERHALRYPAGVVPNDLYFPQQYGLTKINASDAWEITLGRAEVVVAVIDTGVDHQHLDLVNNIWVNRVERDGEAGIDDDNNGYIDDIHGWDFVGYQTQEPPLWRPVYSPDNDPMDHDGHGTHVAGIIAAEADNSIGISGVAPNIKIMPLKVEPDNGSTFPDFAIIEAIYYAIANGAHIVNCSFGGGGKSGEEEAAFQALHTNGLLSVCAAGNYGDNNDTTSHYPSNYDVVSLIAVASSDQNDALYYRSNFGQTTVDIMAPGVGIKSTLPGAAFLESLVRLTLKGGTRQYPAADMEYAGTTDGSGLIGEIVDCGQGYPDQIPDTVAGNIALVKRGNRDGQSHYFRDKVLNVQNAGAVAAIVYNHLADDAYDDWTIGSEGNWIPVVCTSKDTGEELQGMPYLLPGELSGSNQIGPEDSILALQISTLDAPQLNLDSEILARVDVDGDAAAGVSEAVYVLQVLSGLRPANTAEVINRLTSGPENYGNLTGTSMATPHVSGVAALVLSQNPGLTPMDVKSMLLNSVDPIASAVGKMVSGGRLNAYRALLP